MDFTFIVALALLARWLHILAAMAAVGGLMFMRFALLPAAATLADPHRAALQEAIRRRWSKVVMMSITMLLVSGLCSFFTLYFASKSWPEAWRNGPFRIYQMLFGIKFLLALAIFFISSALVGRSTALARFRERAKFWVTVNLVLAVLLVAISGGLRSIHAGPTVWIASSSQSPAPSP